MLVTTAQTLTELVLQKCAG